MEIVHVNPPSLHTNPAFSQGVLVKGDHDILYVGGQNGTDSTGAMVPGGVAAQSAQAVRNVLAVLAEAGVDQSAVVRLSIAIVAGESLETAYAGVVPVWGAHPTAIVGAFVAGLARPDALIEVEAVAAVPRR
ncbi:RidA family protein [Agromyces protaetiae]|nr:RidA family protein [Agromyces protaetiae]